MLCEEPGCTQPGVECSHDDDETPSFYCIEHCHANGFCYLCGAFWGGVESFEFRRSRLCDNCEFEARHEDDDEELEVDDDFENAFYDDEDFGGEG